MNLVKGKLDLGIKQVRYRISKIRGMYGQNQCEIYLDDILCELIGSGPPGFNKCSSEFGFLHKALGCKRTNNLLMVETESDKRMKVKVVK